MNRTQHRRQHLAGLSACIEGMPEVAKVSGPDSESFDDDIAVSLASAALSAISAIGWNHDQRDAGELRHDDDTLFVLRTKPTVALRRLQDEEFARHQPTTRPAHAPSAVRRSRSTSP